MKILMINKFLYPNGGSETYIFKLGEYLQSIGHTVEYFGMEHEGRIVGNSVNAYTSDMDFHGGSKLSKLTYPIKTIYSTEARRQIRKVLDDFKPDVCHLNNFNYQLTPSIILEIVKWRKQENKECKIVYTAHDYQLVCPNHMCRNNDENCEKCLNGSFINCTKGICIHNSLLKSFIGTLEASFWKINGAYKYIDKIVCCSHFMKSKLDTNPVLKEKTVALHNFVDNVELNDKTQKQDYVLYFGRYSDEKGVSTLIEVCKRLPDIRFIFAGTGPLESELTGVSNITNVGFKSGVELKELIAKAMFSICPSQCYDNCPFSVMESIMLATPVIGSKIGGIPELIEEGINGDLFESGNAEDLKNKIELLYKDEERLLRYTENCKNHNMILINRYYEELIKDI